MSNFDIKNALASLQKYLDKNNNGGIDNSDFKALLKEGDINGDSIFTQEELEELYKDNAEFNKNKDEILEAFGKIAGLNSENGEFNLTLDDLQVAMDEINKAETPSSSGGGGGGVGGGGGGVGPQNTELDTDPADQPTTPKVNDEKMSPAELAKAYNEHELSNKRSSALDEISAQRTERDEAAKEAKAETAKSKESYNEKTAALAEAITQQEKQLTTLEQNIVDTQELQAAMNEEINAQNTVISECNSKVGECQTNKTTLEGQLSSLVAPPQTITETDEEGNTITKDNPDYQVYLDKKAEWEAAVAEATEQLAAAELELADAEAALTALQTELTGVEQNLQASIDEYMAAETTTDEAIKGMQEGINEANNLYQEAKQKELGITQSYDDAILQAQEKSKRKS